MDVRAMILQQMETGRNTAGLNMLLKALLERVALGQCAANAPDTVGPDDKLCFRIRLA